MPKREPSEASPSPLRCTHCASEKTPQWRAGPMGPKTLCNACGVRYKSGRLVPEYRSAASPTFVLTQHSNSHRKILELRCQNEASQQQPPEPQKPPKPRKTAFSSCDSSSSPAPAPHPAAAPKPILKSAFKRPNPAESTPEETVPEKKKLRFKTTTDASEQQVIEAMQKIASHIKTPAKAVMANELFTDDSFLFSKAAGRLKEAISNLPVATDDDETLALIRYRDLTRFMERSSNDQAVLEDGVHDFGTEPA
ncbi:hypothetical protein FF1_042584 [Malus domestica]